MRETDDFQATITLGPVNRVGQDLSASLELMITLPMPDQNERLPDTIEATVHAAGLEVKRRLFRALIEKADRELVLEGRDGKGGEGLQRRGTRPFTFKTRFGPVTVERCRISHKRDGAMEIPSASAWARLINWPSPGTSVTRSVIRCGSNLPARASRRSANRPATPNLLGRNTVIEIVHEQGVRLIAAERQRARAILDGASEEERAALGPSLADDPEGMPAYEPDDDPPLDPEDPEWQQAPPPEWVVTDFPGCDPSPPVPREEPRAVDDAVVIVEPDEVKTKAQPSTGRKEIWTSTAVVLVAGLKYALADATTEGLWLQVSALLLELEVLSGGRRLLVLGDGASWIRTWFESLGIDPKAMIVCWWHLRKR